MTDHSKFFRACRAAVFGLLLISSPGFAAQTSSATAREVVRNWIEEEKRPDAAQTRTFVQAGARLVDVRSQAEWDEGHAIVATHLPVGDVAEKATQVLPDKEQPVVLYCAVGARSWWAARALRKQGYTQVLAMTGGFDDLKAAGFEIEFGQATKSPER